MTQAPATPSFGDVVENGWASEENPTRKGYFVRSFKRIGRINPGLTWLITDRAGYFWELQPRVIGDKLTVTPLAAALEAQQARIAELEEENRGLIALEPWWSEQAVREIKLHEETRALADRYEKALTEVRDLEPVPFEGGLDWAAIGACEDCQNYKDHPLMRGICNTHRRPLHDRESHDSREEKRLGWRAKCIARQALSSQGVVKGELGT